MTRIRGVILDWAGTTMDYGSRAPARAFVEVFRRCGDIEIGEAEARAPMGLSKRDHIAAIAATERVASAWLARHGRALDNDDVQAMYEAFVPLQRQQLATSSDLIPGTLTAIADSRRRGLKIGSTTGYTRQLMEVVWPLAAAAGYAPDVTICADDVPAGRPAPWMIFRAAEQLNLYPLASVLVVDDTLVGIEAGRNAGAITVAVTQTGNALGVSLAEVEAMPPAELDARLAAIEASFRAAGADHVVRSIADLPALLDRLEQSG